VSEIADIISIITGIMTILGISGILSWSFTRESGGSFSSNSISVFAKSVKLGLCLIFQLILIIPMQGLHIFLVLALGEGVMPASAHNPDFWWKENYWYAYVISYLIGILLWLPACTLSFSVIYTWSLAPVNVFIQHLRGNR
jgi:hypothetical protein